MVGFNPGPIPQAKDEMPDWTKVTHPISDVLSDKSTAIGIATAAKGLEDISGIIETTAKDVINKDVRSTVEPIREDYTNQLLATKAIVQGAGGVVPPGGMDLTERVEGVGPTGPVPQGVDTGLRKVDRIQNLLTYGSGKLGVDEVYYDMRLKSAVTDLRSKYPGFVDYIDTRVAAITGMNPANETIRDITRQIAALQSSKKTEFDKEMDIARSAFKDGMRGAREQLEALQRNGPDYLPTWRSWYEQESRKWQEIKERDALRKDKVGTTEENREVRKADWTNLVASKVSSAASTLITVTGMDKPMTAVQLMEDFQNNPTKYNPQMISEFATKLRAQGAALSRELEADASKTDKDRSGKTYSYYSDVGAAEVKSVKDNIMAYYKNMDDALMSGGPQGAGMAFYWARQAAAMGENKKFEVYSGPEGENIALWEVLKNSMGDQAVPPMMKMVTKQNMDQSVNKLFELNMLKAKTQKDSKGNPNPTPYTFKDLNNQAMTLEQQGQITKAIRSRYVNGGVNVMLADITDPKASDEAKINSLKFFFSPEGQGALAAFNNDRINPITNKQVPGKQTLWNKFTAPELVASVKKLADKDPSVGEMYTTWIKNEAASQLYYKDFIDLQTITGRDDLWIKYNDGKEGQNTVPHITLMQGKGALASPVGQSVKVPTYGIPTVEQIAAEKGIDKGRLLPNQGLLLRAEQTINRVNEALRGVDRVNKGMGSGDASAELLGFLIQAQAYQGKNWEGLPKEIINAIAAAQGKGKLKDLYKEQQKAE